MDWPVFYRRNSWHAMDNRNPRLRLDACQQIQDRLDSRTVQVCRSRIPSNDRSNLRHQLHVLLSGMDPLVEAFDRKILKRIVSFLILI